VEAAKTGNGINALHLACDKGHAAVCSVLCDPGGARVNVCDREGYYPVHWACREGHLDAALVLLAQKGQVAASAPPSASLTSALPPSPPPLLS